MMPRTGIAALLLALALPAIASAQTYPVKPVQLIAASPTGSASDLMARLLADRLGAKLGPRFLVVDRPSAGGIAAAQFVATARPDGYTLLVAQASTLAMNPHLTRSVPLDVVKDLTAVILLGAQPLAVAVPANSPFTTLPELIAGARRSPGKLNVAVISLSLSQLAKVLLDRSAGVSTNLVPFTAQSELTTAGLAGEVDVLINGAGSVLDMVRAGKLRALAVTGPDRLEVLADVPTVAETLKGYEADSWFGVFAPAGTDLKVVATLNAAINNLLRDPDFRARILQQGTSPRGGTPETLRDRLARDYEKFGVLIHDAGIEPN